MIFNKKRGLLSVAMVVFLFAAVHTAAKKKEINPQAPAVDNIQIIKTYSGSTFMGRIVEIGAEEVTFETYPNVGTLLIPVADISSIEEFPQEMLRDGQFWFPNPNATRLFFSPTGRMQSKGHGYFADYYILFPMAAYGVTDWFGIGGGFTLVPFIQVWEQGFYLMPRVGIIQQEKFAWSGGVLFAKLPGFDDEDYLLSAGIVYTTATYGTLDLSVTAGTGYGFVIESYIEYDTQNRVTEFSGMDLPMFMVGGEWRCARRVSLVSENWIIPEIESDLPVVLSYGARLFGEQISVDLGFVVPLPLIEEELPLFPGIPYVDFVYNF